jgi:3-hydroxybutyryl-CoA dehydrogenase
MSEKTIAVVGAGVMGSGLALDLACHCYRVILKDLTADRLKRAERAIRSSYQLVKLKRGESLSVTLDEILGRVKFATDYSEFRDAEIVIENITENFEVKRQVYEDLNRICRENVLFGVNTSCISITRIASLMSSPDNVIGMHFLNPVPLKALVEVIRGRQTSDMTLERTREFLLGLGKTIVVVNDFPGFVTNRVLMLTINESIWLVQDRVAEPKDIDKIFKLGFEHKMGPLATADLIGLDTILNSLLVLHDSYKDPKFRPCPLLQVMVDAGLLGQKSGKGFFEYSAVR